MDNGMPNSVQKTQMPIRGQTAAKHPDPNASFIIQADANDVAVNMVLLQHNQHGALQLGAYTFKTLTETEKGGPPGGKKAYAVRWALLTMRYFLQASKIPFKMWTDHKYL